MTAEQADQIIDLLNQGSQPPLWPFVLTPTVALIGALLALTTAIVAIRTQRATAKRRATLDAIIQFESDPVYRQAVATYRQFRSGNISLGTITDPKSDADNAYLEQLNSFWNWHEVIGIGLRRDTLDDEIMLQWWGEAMVVTWNNSVAAIDHHREKQGTARIFKNYEITAREFATRLAQQGRTGLPFDEPKVANVEPFPIRWRPFSDGRS